MNVIRTRRSEMGRVYRLTPDMEKTGKAEIM
jgi:hypothetical protein